MLMRKEAQGEMVVSTSVPPFGEGETRATIEMLFEEGWRAWKLVVDLIAMRRPFY